MARFLWLRAETFIHVGAGGHTGLIDLPFARETATGFPYIPGSGMKGALRDAARAALGWSGSGPEPKEVADWFGRQEEAGQILVSDARLAFLPVRSLNTSYRYVISTDLIKRLIRDRGFAGLPSVLWTGAPQAASQSEAAAMFVGEPGEKLFLEEFPFIHGGSPGLDDLLAEMPADPRDDVLARATVLSHHDFDYFARHGLHVRTRNKLDPVRKTVDGGALWTEESLPPDTLMYIVLVPRVSAQAGALDRFMSLLHGKARGYLQVGGNETVGEGWFSVLQPDPPPKES